MNYDDKHWTIRYMAYAGSYFWMRNTETGPEIIAVLKEPSVLGKSRHNKRWWRFWR